MRQWTRIGGLLLGLAIASTPACKDSSTGRSARPDQPIGTDNLKGPAAFATIRDNEDRARALFTEMAKVLQHPRCMNCHPETERPLQGNEGRPHEPLVVRGNGGLGAPGMFCTTCHGQANYLNVPGNAKWVLAPAEMAWMGKSLPDLCAQLKDPERNGNRDLAAVHRHIEADSLVAYGWNPPAHLEPAPGNQATMAALFAAWMKAGAHCPSS